MLRCFKKRRVEMVEGKRSNMLCIIAFTLVVMMACAGAPPKPGDIIPPNPIPGNTGKYMCPYTQDGVVAKWCDKAVNASIGATIGKTAGAYVGARLLENVPFVGGFVGQKAGEAIGRSVAIKASGGMKYIVITSDLSFDSIEDMAVWMYATKSSNEHYQQVIKATNDIYPQFNKVYWEAIRKAPRR